VHSLDIPVDHDDVTGLHHSQDPDLDLSLSIAASPQVLDPIPRATYGGRPPSIRKGESPLEPEPHTDR
jgi:hypothetical protein